MFDDFSKRAKAVRAALALAQQKGWGDISLADIAQAAGLSLADLRREFSCKNDILRAFQAEVDGEVLAKAKAPASAGQTRRDRLFDIIMTRFEVMAPYKPALRRISSYLCCHPGEGALLACSSLASHYWMLAGAGAKLDGPGGALRVTGLAAIYGKVFQVWLDDPSPSLDKTMAALDRRLSRGERWLTSIETTCKDFCRFGCGFLPRGWGRRDRAEPPAPPTPPPAPGPAPAATI
jgi:ubiquinone biosynthesis protein COQ9